MSLTSSDPKALNERLLTVLKDVVGRSTSARSLSQKLGHSHNYVRRLFSGEIPLQTETLLDILQRLGMPQRLFFDQVFEGLPATDPVAVLRFYRENDGLPRDPFLDEIGPRMEALLEKPVDTETVVESRRAELDRLEELRFDDRDAAKEGIEAFMLDLLVQDAAMSRVPKTVLSDLTTAGAIWSTIQRVAGYLQNSSTMYEVAFACSARLRFSDHSAAVCFQKASYLLRDCDAAEAGLRFLDQALKIYLRFGDRRGIGMVQVDRGILHGYLDRMAVAAEHFQSALELLPKDAVRNRASAFASLARCQEDLADLDPALTNIRMACDLYQGHEDIVAAQILVIRGRLARKLNYCDEAQDCFVAGIDMYRKAGNPTYVIVVALEYAGLLLDLQETRKLAQLADEVLGIAKYFRRNRIVDAALMEFIRTAKWGELTESILKEAQRRLSEAASKP